MIPRLDPARQTAVVCTLGVAQTIAWGSSYYLPAILATPAAADLGLRPVWIFGGFSIALVISGLVGPTAGRIVDRYGGRGVLSVSNLVLAAGLVAFATCSGPVSLCLAWMILGLGMGIGLYDTAFSTLARVYGALARSPITGITLIAGLASTVGWPLTGYLEAHLGWRGACLVWAAIHLTLALPLNLILPRATQTATGTAAPAPRGAVLRGQDGRFWLLAFVFAAVAFIATSMAAHLPRLFEAAGAGPATAIAAGALIGPSQVVGRLLEYGFLRRVHPLWSARIAAAAHPLAALGLVLVGSPMGFAFAILHGLGNGILTISRGTVPLSLFGAEGYGARQGLLMAPAHVTQAAAPLVFGLALSVYGVGAIWFSATLGALAALALCLIKPNRA